MKARMVSTFAFIKRHKFLVGIPVIILLGIFYFSRGGPAQTYETAAVKKGNVVQEVSVTGRVESDSMVSLAFERAGRVVSEPAAVGTHAKKGDVLVRLDSREADALRLQAKANLDYESVQLTALKRGARPEDVRVSEAGVASAEAALSDARDALDGKLNEAYTQADDAIRNKTDVLFTNARTRDPRAVFTSSDDKLIADIQATRAALEPALLAANNDRSLSNVSDAAEVTGRMEALLDQTKTHLDKLALAVGSAISSPSISQTTIDGWKVSVATARTNINAAIAALTAADTGYRAAYSALVVAQDQLALKKAGATIEQLAAQEARISAQRALLANYDAQIAKSLLVAPFAGVVTKQDAKQGETVSPNVPVVSLMSDGVWKVTANVAEVDVAKIALGDTARITLDAYGVDVQFKASVASIDPAETIVEGVSTYKVTLRFDVGDERIRSGMTANIDISTDKREDVLYIPARSVFTQDDKRYVKIPNGPIATTLKEVTTGLRGSDGSIEILSGLSEGDTIVTFEKK